MREYFHTSKILHLTYFISLRNSKACTIQRIASPFIYLFTLLYGVWLGICCQTLKLQDGTTRTFTQVKNTDRGLKNSRAISIKTLYLEIMFNVL